MAAFHIIILGAGPAGLSAALAISRLAAQQPSSAPALRVTVLEVRPAISTLGGSVNLTPVAMRYLDRLGVGSALRQRGMPVRAIELVSLRTGHRVGRLWPDVDALRANRHELVSAMLETARNEEHSERIEIRYGVRTLSIREEGSPSVKEGRIVVKLEEGEEISGDLLVGCDGLHSSVRKLYVEPEREEVYSGKAVAYGFVPVTTPGSTGLCRTDGQPAVEDTTVISSRYGSLLVTFCDPQRYNAHVSAVMEVKDEKDGSRDGWKARGEDKQKVQADILASFADGGLKHLSSFLGKVDDWTMYPVYILPRQGNWSRGRALLIGDAAHAMPPQGESTGLAIEDGVLLAHVLSRHATRSIDQLLADYEMLRRQTIDAAWGEADWRWKGAAKADAGWFSTFLMEAFMSSGFIVSRMNARANKHFASDVDLLELPE